MTQSISVNIYIYISFALLAFTAIPKSAEATADYGDFIPMNGEVTFTNTGDPTDTEQEIVLNIANDNDWEDTEELQITMAFTNSPPVCHMLGEVDKSTVVILDDDEPGKSKLLHCSSKFINSTSFYIMNIMLLWVMSFCDVIKQNQSGTTCY